jgi:TrmH family RNA methyltransferase
MNQLPKLTRARALDIMSLDSSAGRRKHGRFRIEGRRAIEAATVAGVRLVELMVRTDLVDEPGVKGILKRQGSVGCDLLAVSTKTSAKLASVVRDQGVIAVAEIPKQDLDTLRKVRRIVFLAGVQDPGNVGTIVRCASWFGFGAVIAGPGTADFYNPKVVRSMAGAVWDVKLATVADMAIELKELTASGHEIVGADMRGQSLGSWKPKDKMVLILGSEAHGLTDEIKASIGTFIRIEGGDQESAGVESLNVAMAAGIIMHYAFE